LSGLTLAGRIEEGCNYVPTLPYRIKRILREIPIQDHSQFTFIDFGSGKGRVLFVAAEYPYRRIQGVEFARELHLQAQENLRTFSGWKQQCARIESVYMDASDFEFPEDNLVLYFFNPFTASIMRRVLGNLRSSLDRNPREVFLVSVYFDEFAPLLDSLPWLHVVRHTYRYRIYRVDSQTSQRSGAALPGFSG
jgi:hypothetical protein